MAYNDILIHKALIINYSLMNQPVHLIGQISLIFHHRDKSRSLIMSVSLSQYYAVKVTRHLGSRNLTESNNKEKYIAHINIA